MPALKFDFIIEQGVDFGLSFPLVGGEDISTANDWAIAGQVRADYNSASPVLYDLPLIFQDSNVILDIPAVDSSAWTWRRARYDIELTDPDGRVVRLMEGRVCVLPEITRP